MCSGSHYLTARLAIEHPSRTTIIDSVGCSRPTLFAPEPRLLILGSYSCRVGSDVPSWFNMNLMRLWTARRTPSPPTPLQACGRHTPRGPPERVASVVWAGLHPL